MGQAVKDKNDTPRVPRSDSGAPSSKTQKMTKQDQEHLKNLPLYMGEVTWRVALPIILLSLGGHWLDGKYSTRPVLSIIGVLLSILFASLLVYRFIIRTFPDSFGGKK